MPGELSGESARVTAALATHQVALMRYPHVVAVAEGARTRGGQQSGEPCIVVYVDQKVPRGELSDDDTLPESVGGVPIDVVAAGEIRAQGGRGS